MNISELIENLKEKLEKYWDEKVIVKIDLWFWDYDRKEISSISHLWEDWLHINLQK